MFSRGSCMILASETRRPVIWRTILGFLRLLGGENEGCVAPRPGKTGPSSFSGCSSLFWAMSESCSTFSETDRAATRSEAGIRSVAADDAYSCCVRSMWVDNALYQVSRESESSSEKQYLRFTPR